MVAVNVERILSTLKDFQRDTVDYVFRRLYLDDPPAHRFLIADEVGLGKTMVARGIIARSIEHLRDEVQRVDVVYVCSNAAIAHQNINRLNVTGQRDFAMATRLTLLPLELHKLKAKDGEHKVNFISFTPGTTFDLKSSGGIKEERALLYDLLRYAGLDVSHTALRNLLQCGVGLDNWKGLIGQTRNIDPDLQQAFHVALRLEAKLMERVLEACERFGRWRENVPDSDSELRYQVIGALRQKLAQVCIDALEPDLVILDEFQRFKDLLHSDSEAAQLAKTLMSFQAGGQRVRVLLLSATPYRMMTLDHEADDDHYKDFLDTLGFLFGDDAQVEAVTAGLSKFRKALYGIGTAGDEAMKARDDVQARLLSVMTRTERVGSTTQLDAMVEEPKVETDLQVVDLHHAQFVSDIARTVGAPDPIEYWKSSPYLLQFMKGYDLKRRFGQHMEDGSTDLATKLRAGQRCLLTPDQIRRYEPIAFANARLRALARDVLDSGMWRMLWMPPSLPYLQPQGAYAIQGEVSKALVFSSWNVVPDAIAALLSYEAERLMLGDEVDKQDYADLTRKRRGLLRFSVDPEGRPTGMPALALLYPCATLASQVDPLALAVRLGAGKPVTEVQVRRQVTAQIEMLLADAGLAQDEDDRREDERWYWAALAFLDRHQAPAMEAWCQTGWIGAGAGHEEEPGQGFVDHVALFGQAFRGELQPPLGRIPKDLPDVLADLALAGPGVCASRALRRIAPTLHPADSALASAAARLAGGLRTLFNLPETMALLRGNGEDSPYWRRVLRQGLDGNLQAVLDEYAHVLREALGLVDHAPADVVREVASEVADALSLRTSRLDLDTFDVGKEGKVECSAVHLRCRFALRFGDIQDDNGAQLARADVVRQAFNSPFRPFVLASTSVGQEGLDFHPYCHVLYHWNLPSNPVDMEQREGRVHRYKGHAVRKNVARKFGLGELRGRWLCEGDPWQVLFERARETRPEGASDLIPYWIYEVEGGARVQRKVPMVPLSREHGQLVRLKRSLALYRLVFGQPRQQDLLAHLERRVLAGETVDVARWRISLKAPGRVVVQVEEDAGMEVPVLDVEAVARAGRGQELVPPTDGAWATG
jgi:hypothetical protein